MKRLLFLSNGTKPDEQEYESLRDEKLTNFSIPAVKAANSFGIDVTIGINRKYAKQVKSDYAVSFFNAEIYRNPFNLREVYKAYKNVCEELNKGDYLAIHCNTPIGGVIGRLAGKKCKIKKIIYQAHGFHFYKGAPLINRLIYYPIEKWLAHYTDVLITINQEDYLAAQRMTLRKNGNVYLVHGVGIETESYLMYQDGRINKREALGLKDDDVALISMGDLVARKNYSASIEAIANVHNAKLHYFICGEGPEKSKLERLVSKHGLENQVHFLGYRKDIKELLAATDIFLFTSLQEGLPRSLMEAMASGLPCVVSRIRGNVDLLEDGYNGFLCDVADYNEVADAIKVLSNDEALRRKMGQNNLRSVKLYDSRIVEKEMYDIYYETFITKEDNVSDY